MRGIEGMTRTKKRDVIAGNRKQAASRLANFRQLAGARPVKTHPLVGWMIDSDLLAIPVPAHMQAATKSSTKLGWHDRSRRA